MQGMQTVLHLVNVANADCTAFRNCTRSGVYSQRALCIYARRELDPTALSLILSATQQNHTALAVLCEWMAVGR